MFEEVKTVCTMRLELSLKAAARLGHCGVQEEQSEQEDEHARLSASKARNNRNLAIMRTKGIQ